MRRALATLLVAGCASGPLGDGAATDAAPAPDLAQMGAGAVGDACKANGDCATGECLTDLMSKMYFGGYCTRFDCDARNLACPAGSTCKPGGDGHQYCLRDCDPTLGEPQCRGGYGCCSGPGPVGNLGWCAPMLSALCLAN